MKKYLCSVLFLLAVFHIIPLFAEFAAYVDGSWNSPLVYAFDNSIPIKYSTAFKAEFDRENLYITVKCDEPDAVNMGKTPRQMLRAWPMVESVEIFLDPPQLKKYVQLAVGVNGNFYDSRKNKKDIGWKYELSFHSGYWQLKFIIPFADLGVSAETGESWKFNLCRNVRHSDNFNSTWAHVGSAFHNPANFGSLIFGSKEASARAQKAKMKKMIAELEKDFRKKGVYPAFKDKLEVLKKNCTVQNINALREEAQVVEILKGL